MQRQFVRTSSFEDGCVAFLSILGRALTLRTVVLVDGTTSAARVFGWASAGAQSGELAAATERAQAAWLGAQGPPAARATASHELTGGLSSRLDERQLALPLLAAPASLLGILYLQVAAPLGGVHRAFASAAAHHLALALDRHRAVSVGRAVAQDWPSSGSPPGKPIDRPRVLVVDGAAGNVSALSIMLADEGFAVETALCAEQAIDKARACLPDVLLIDGDARGLSALELARSARAQGFALRVIVMSWRSEQEIRSLAQGCAVRHVAKPLDIDALIALISQAAV